ncbi:MAG TPA: glycerophosphodiester phosphodiesterase [Streptosporangiaceae bacterium]|nr:glycerophosphodiester phosphodiesterase [Streptosporangiaceae bacterium]
MPPASHQPGSAPAGYLDYPRPIAFAHRGGAGHFPENSWRAFEHAVGLGYAYLETDVHATADGVLMAFHDKTLDRVTQATGPVAGMPYRKVAAARIGGSEPIPLLADLLGAWPDVRFNVDVKDAPAVGPLAEVLRRTAAWDRVCVTSFSGLRLHAVRRALSRPVCMATSPAGIGAVRLGLPPGMLAAGFARAWVGCTQIPIRMATASYIRRAHAAGLQVHVWTVNEPSLMAALLDLGVDGIMTDETEKLRAVLAGRGQWHPRGTG